MEKRENLQDIDMSENFLGFISKLKSTKGKFHNVFLKSENLNENKTKLLLSERLY